MWHHEGWMGVGGGGGGEFALGLKTRWKQWVGENLAEWFPRGGLGDARRNGR